MKTRNSPATLTISIRIPNGATRWPIVPVKWQPACRGRDNDDNTMRLSIHCSHRTGRNASHDLKLDEHSKSKMIETIGFTPSYVPTKPHCPRDSPLHSSTVRATSSHS